MKVIGIFLLKLVLKFGGSTLFSLQVVLAERPDAPAPDTLTALNAPAHLETATRSGLLYDVAVIGGGSAGVYAAVRLKDQGKKVAVIERQNYLGGHFETYTDPKSSIPVQLGVQVFPDNKLTRDFFSRFNIALTYGSLIFPSDTKYLDFTTGKPVSYAPPGAAAQGAALGRYAAQVAKYPGLSNASKIPYPVPADLLLTFSDFVKKYDLGDLLPVIALVCEGWGDFLNIPAVYVLIFLNDDFIKGTPTNSYLTTSAGDSSLLFKAASSFLGNAVRLSTTVKTLVRLPDLPNLILLNTPQGPQVIAAKKIISAFPQVIDNFAGWDLDSNERSIFSTFNATAWYIALLRNTGIPANTTLQNVAANTPFNLPALPGVYNFGPSPNPSLTFAYYGTQDQISIDAAKSGIYATLDRLKAADAISKTGKNDAATIVSHGNYQLRVAADQIKDGFYKKLYELQGKRDTFYTGAGFDKHSSSSIWAYTESLVSDVVKAL